MSQPPFQRCPLEQKSLRIPPPAKGRWEERSSLGQDCGGLEAGNLDLHHSGFPVYPVQGTVSRGVPGPPWRTETDGLAHSKSCSKQLTEVSGQALWAGFQSQLLHHLRPWAAPTTGFFLLKCRPLFLGFSQKLSEIPEYVFLLCPFFLSLFYSLPVFLSLPPFFFTLLSPFFSPPFSLAPL